MQDPYRRSGRAWESEPLASKPGNLSNTWVKPGKTQLWPSPGRPKSGHRRTKALPKLQRALQGCSGTPQERSKASSGLPRNAPRALREPPRAIRETSRAIQEPPRALRELQGCSKSAPEQRLRSKTRRRFDSSLRFWRESESSSERDKRAATLHKSGNTQPIEARESERAIE